jgi:hypothetical protein
VASLFRTRPASEEELAVRTHALRKRGCVTILLLYLPYLLSLCLGVAAASLHANHLQMLMFTFVPVLTSTLDPLILCSRNTELRRDVVSRVGDVVSRVLRTLSWRHTNLPNVMFGNYSVTRKSDLSTS